MPTKAKTPSLPTDFMKRWDRNFGPGSLVQAAKLGDYQVIPSGSVALDNALGVGGYVQGRIYQWYGPPDVGKTAMVMIACAEAQRYYPNKVIGYIDVEHKVDRDQAERLGVDLNRLWLSRPETAEQAADQVALMVADPSFSVVAVDSIGAMIGSVEMDKVAEEQTVAVVARIVTRLVRSANALAHKHGPVIHLINQTRSNIDSRSRQKTTLPGGRALSFQTTGELKLAYTTKEALTIDIGPGRKLPVSREIAVEVARNKCAPRGRVAMIQLATVATETYGPVGIDTATEAAEVGVACGVIARNGAWYTLPGADKGLQGLPAVSAALRGDPAALEALRTAIVATRAHEVTDDLGVPLDPDQLPPEIQEDLSPSRRSPFPSRPDIALVDDGLNMTAQDD